jgi:hypothetical protein
MTTPWTPDQEAALRQLRDRLMGFITTSTTTLSKLITAETIDVYMALTALTKLLVERGILSNEDRERLPAMQRELAAGLAVDQALTSQATEPMEPDGA